MMVVMPALAQRYQCYQQVVGAVVFGFVGTTSDEMTEGVERPEKVMAEEDSKKAPPEDTGQKGLERLRGQATEYPGQNQSCNTPTPVVCGSAERNGIII